MLPGSYLYEELGDRFSNDLEHLGSVLPTLDAEAGDDEVGQPGDQAAQRFQRQQNQNRQPVEAVMDRGPSECTAWI